MTDTLRDALLNVSVHSAHLPGAPRELLVELLKRCGEIARAALGGSVPSPDQPRCHDCRRPYGDEHGFPDLVVPHEIWNAHLSPRRGEGGLLCPSCMCKRAFDAGLKDVPAQFRSGPFAVHDDGPVELRASSPAPSPEPTEIR